MNRPNPPFLPYARRNDDDILPLVQDTCPPASSLLPLAEGIVGSCLLDNYAGTARRITMPARKSKPRGDTVKYEDISLETLLERYQVYNRAVNKSPRTVEWYYKNVGMFMRWMEQQGHPSRLPQVTIDLARAYVVAMKEKTQTLEGHPFAQVRQRGLASITIEGRVRSLRAFFHWIYREDYTSKHILQDLEVPKVQQKAVDILTEEEIRRVMDSINPETVNGARAYALVWTLLDTGLRASELAGLTMEDARLEDGYLRVLGKGNKERVVPLGVNCQRILLRYRDRFRVEPDHPSVDTFFLSVDGAPLNRNALLHIVRRVGRRAGVPRLHPHLLRHTFCTRFLINGGDVFTLQRILGHTTLSMVNHYVQLASSQVMVQYRRHSPMDAMGLSIRRRGVPGGGGAGRAKAPSASGNSRPGPSPTGLREVGERQKRGPGRPPKAGTGRPRSSANGR